MTTPAFTAHPTRFDPYKNFRFLLKFDGVPVAGVSEVSDLSPKAEVVKHREGGDASLFKGTGRSKFEPITLERGVTHDTGFQHWANAVQGDDSWTGDTPRVLKDIIVEALNEAGCVAAAYTILDCWVSHYQALPDLDAGGNAMSIQVIKLENHGWRRNA